MFNKPTLMKRINPFATQKETSISVHQNEAHSQEQTSPNPSWFKPKETKPEVKSEPIKSEVNVKSEVKPEVKPDLIQSRYECLKSTAQELLKRQSSSKADVDVLIGKLEKSLQVQTESYRKLQEEKTRLQTVIDTEQEILKKLKFDITVLNMTCERIKAELSKFQSKVKQYEQDKGNMLSDQNEALKKGKNQSEFIEKLKRSVEESEKSLQQNSQSISLLEDSIRQKDLSLAETKEQSIALSNRLAKEMRDLEICLELKEQQWIQHEQQEAKKNEEIISNLTNEISNMNIHSSSVEKKFHEFQEEASTKEATLKLESEARSELIVQQNEQINLLQQRLDDLQLTLRSEQDKISLVTTEVSALKGIESSLLQKADELESNILEKESLLSSKEIAIQDITNAMEELKRIQKLDIDALKEKELDEEKKHAILVSSLRDSLTASQEKEKQLTEEYKSVLENKNEEICTLTRQVSSVQENMNLLEAVYQSMQFSNQIQTFEREKSTWQEKYESLLLQRDNVVEKLAVIESERKLYEENLNTLSKQRELESRNYQETIESLTKKLEDVSNYSEKVKSLSNQRNVFESAATKQKSEKIRKRDEELNTKANENNSKPQKSRDTNRTESHSPKQKSKILSKSSPKKHTKSKKPDQPKNFEEKVRAYKRKGQSFESSSSEEPEEDCEPRFEEPKKKDISMEEISEDPLSLKQQKKKAALASSSQDFDHLSKLKGIANAKQINNGRQSIRRDEPVKHKSNGAQKKAKLSAPTQSKSNQKSRKDVDLFDDVFAFH